jgi:acyl-CoA thioester hydrolase
VLELAGMMNLNIRYLMILLFLKEAIMEHTYQKKVRYKHTDFSKAVYYSNYLVFMEEAREEILGTDRLLKLWEEQGVGFAVIAADLKYQDAAQFGETLEVRSTMKMDGKFRVVLNQDVWRPEGKKAAVTGRIELVCLNSKNRPVAIESVIDDMSIFSE